MDQLKLLEKVREYANQLIHESRYQGDLFNFDRLQDGYDNLRVTMRMANKEYASSDFRDTMMKKADRILRQVQMQELVIYGKTLTENKFQI